MSCRRFIFLSALLMVIIAAVVAPPLWAGEPLRVGLFQNKPIVYDEDGPKGLFVEILDYVAQKEKWQVEYVSCELKDCLDQIQENKLDLMTSLGQSHERLEYLIFSEEPVWTFWGTLLANDLSIKSIFDLKDKRIGVREGNKTTVALKKLLKDFEIPVQYVEFDNYELAFDALQNKDLDMVAVNNTYAFRQQIKSSFFKTPIVFNPFSAYYAVPRHGGDQQLLNTIDQYVKELKMDKSSIYHTFEQKWFGGATSYFSLKKIGIAVAILFSLLVFAMAFWRYRSLVSINRELTRNINLRRQTQSELQESEKRFRLIADSMPQLIWTAGPDGVVDYQNKRLMEIMAVVSRGAHVVHPEDRQQTARAWFNAVQMGKNYRMEHRLLYQAGIFHWHLSLGMPVRDSQGNIIKWYGSSTDIEEVREARERLAHQQRLLSQTQETSKVGGWEYDLDTGLMAWTKETCRIHEVDINFDPNSISENISFYEPEALKVVEKAFFAAVEKGEEYDLELPLITAKGSRLWVRTIGRVERRDGDISRVFGMIMDITERKEREHVILQMKNDQEAINRIITTTTTTTTTTGVQQILEKVLDEALSLSELEGGTVCLIDPVDNMLHLVAQRQRSGEPRTGLPTKGVTIGTCLCGDCASTRQSLILRNRQDVMALATNEAPQSEDIRFQASFPLNIGTRCLGVLCLYSRSDTAIREHSLELLETVSSQIAIAVDNAQMFEKISHQAALLDEKVKERTEALTKSQQAMQLLLEDMEESGHKLARLNKQFVGRELRMRELKSEIALLRGKREYENSEKGTGTN